ncbi:MAG: H-NS family nucleoid-associated regulatory protein [Aeromonas sp.]
MNEFLKVLLNIRSLRAALRDLPFEQLEEAKEKFDAVYADRAQSVEQERAEQAERLKKLQELQDLMAQAGIHPSELLGGAAPASVGAPKGKREPRPAKYKYMEDGMEKTWTGQGRMPKAIKAATDAGQDLNDFLIK